MSKLKPLIIHPMDPLGNKIGGIATLIKNFIKYVPDDFEIEFVGVTSDKITRPVGKWQTIIACGTKVNFLPILYVKDENVKTKTPLGLKFTLALFRYKKQISKSSNNKILTYHRIEPTLSLANMPGKKVRFIHNNIIDSLYSAHTESKWRHFPWLYFQMEKRLIRRMDKVFVVCQDMVEFYQKKYPFMSDRFSFLPTWVDEDIFFPYQNGVRNKKKLTFLKSQRFPANTKLVLFVGRLEGQKDPLLLIDTFYYANKHLPESRLLIVGDGSLRKDMVTKAEQYRLKDKIVFHGNLTQDKVAELMRISDVVLLTSAFEGMPLSVLEALCCGLPVVSTDVGEVNRVVKDDLSGLICYEKNVNVIGDAVLNVLKENKYSAENCQSCIRDYTARNVLSKIYNAYYDLGSNF